MYNGQKVIDVHGHVSTPAQFRAFAYNLLIQSPGIMTARLAISEELMESAQMRHLTMLNERAIDVQFISPRPAAMMHWGPADIQERWAIATNDVIHQACTLHPDRFAGIAQLPQNSDLETHNCLGELERCIEELGFVGALVNPDPAGEAKTPGLDKEYWFPLYERAQALKVPLIVHGSKSRDRRADSQSTFMMEQTLATKILGQGTVFQRFPDLKVVVVHCGGAPSRFMPHMAATGQERGGQTNMMVERAEEPDEGEVDTSKNLFFDTCAYHEAYLRLQFEQKGAGQFLFGTEVPGAGTATLNQRTGKPSDDLVPVIDSFEELSADVKMAIIGGLAREVFPRFKY